MPSSIKLEYLESGKYVLSKSDFTLIIVGKLPICFSFTGIDPSSRSARVKCQIPYTLKIEQQYITEIEDDTCEGLKDTLVTDSSVVEKTIYPEITLNPINIIRK